MKCNLLSPNIIYHILTSVCVSAAFSEMLVRICVFVLVFVFSDLQTGCTQIEPA